jgi:hypothetical protein
LLLQAGSFEEGGGRLALPKSDPAFFRLMVRFWGGDRVAPSPCRRCVT